MEPLVHPLHADAVRASALCLLENAIQHTPVGGRVRLTCDTVNGIIVEDSGPGMTEEHATQAVEPFACPSPGGSGVGIGLPLANATARFHGGHLTITRSELGGARVAMDLGLARARP